MFCKCAYELNEGPSFFMIKSDWIFL